MLLGLETFSYHMAFRFGTMDILGFIQRTHELGLDGVQVNIGRGANRGNLGSDDHGFLRDVRTMIKDHGMYVEIDTSGTSPQHLIGALDICKALGADTLRTYASIGGDLGRQLAQASQDLKKVLPICADYGVRIAVENHEYETAEDVLRIIRAVDSEYVGALVDTGNSMMVWEAPTQAVRALAPYAVSTHFKDHIVIMDGDEPKIVGVPLGTGSMDCEECFRILANASPLKRINIEVCYGYRAPFRRPQERGAGAELGKGAFRVTEPPFEPSFVSPDSDSTSDKGRKQMLAWQEQAVEESVEFVKQLNARFS